jgi:long-chain acyl-CoA synthetase
VVGVPDRQRGEVLVAFVVLEDGSPATVEQIRQFCGGRLAAHMVPASVRFVADLPRNASGKLLRTTLREEASAPQVT